MGFAFIVRVLQINRGLTQLRFRYLRSVGRVTPPTTGAFSRSVPAPSRSTGGFGAMVPSTCRAKNANSDFAE